MRRIRSALTSQSIFVLTLIVTAGIFGPGFESVAADNGFYKRPPLFAFRPKENRKGQSIDRFGPVGIGIELTLPAFGMKIKNIEKGSPAAATGKLKKGQIIESINGDKLADIDPRIQLGRIITKAEAGDGTVKLMVKDDPEAKAEEVTIQIPAIGEYSDTWPLDCKKSDRIVSDLADSLRHRKNFNISHRDAPAMLFMLSTGEEKDLEVVRGWIKQIVDKYKDAKEINVHNWSVGYCGIALCEYYLRTGDKSIIPVIELLADNARWDMYNNGWAHGTYQGVRDRSKAQMAFPYMGGGHINACGVHVTTFLLLAKECGAKVDEHTLQASLKHFFRFAARGNVAYGDQLPERSFVDNGKTGTLAFTMAAAASLTPNGEKKSLYMQARDNSAVKGFYSTSWMLIGHTGGGVGEIWRSASMGLMYDKNQKKYREFMDNRQWFYELSRRHDGSFGIVGGGRYDQPNSWGVMMGLSYTVPRKTLRLTGAPKTRFSKEYELPKRPWGKPADDVFYANTPATQKNGKVQDLSKETFHNASSRASFDIMGDPAVSDAVLLKYAHHPDHGIRRGAGMFINKHKRYHLIPQLLRSDDPRVRHAGTMAIYCTFKRRPMPADQVTDEMAALLIKMINDPDEALWGVENAMKALSLVRPELIAPAVDRLLYWVKHEEWWLSAAAMMPLSKVAGDKRFYRKVLPTVGQVMIGDTHVSHLQSAGRLFAGLRNADQEVQKMAVKVLCHVYAEFPKPEEIHKPPHKITMEGAVNYLMSLIAGYAAQFPGGHNALYEVAKKRYPDQVLPHPQLFLKRDLTPFNPAVRQAVQKYKEAQQKSNQ